MEATRKFIDAYIEGVWNVYDNDTSGYLDKNETRSFVTQLIEEMANEGLNVPPAIDFDSFFDEYDVDRNGRLSRKEARVFIEQLMIPSTSQMEGNSETKKFIDEYMNEVWLKYDDDKSGYLERIEAREFVDKLIDEMDSSGLDVQGFDFDSCFDSYDQDGNGQLSRKELRVFVEQLMGI